MATDPPSDRDVIPKTRDALFVRWALWGLFVFFGLTFGWVVFSVYR